MPTPIPTLTPDQICALRQEDGAPASTDHVPTSDEVRRVRDRLAFVATLIRSVDESCQAFYACDRARNATGTDLVEAIDVLRQKLGDFERPQDPAIVLARYLAIDCARLVRGVADLCPV